MPKAFRKDPDAVLDYAWNWTAWLAGDTIASYTLDVPEGLTLESDSATSSAVTAWLSGGVAGQSYAVTCHIVTAAGREDDRTVVISVGQS